MANRHQQRPNSRDQPSDTGWTPSPSDLDIDGKIVGSEESCQSTRCIHDDSPCAHKGSKPTHRGAEVLNNHLIIEHIVRYLPDVRDIISLRLTSSGIARDVKHYTVRNAEALDFSGPRGLEDYEIREFLRGISDVDGTISNTLSRTFHTWDRLVHLNLSNTMVGEVFLSNIILQTFSGIEWTDHQRHNFRIGSSAYPESFKHLQSLRAQNCPLVDAVDMITLLQKLLFKKLDKFWDQEEQAVGLTWQVLRPVKSPIGTQIWRGQLPTDVEELDRTGLVGYTRLKKLYIGNCANMAFESEEEPWDRKESLMPEFDQHTFHTNVARWLCLTGALGIETELRFCNSYCDSPSAFLWDGWTASRPDDEVEDKYAQMRLHQTVHRQIKTLGMPRFNKLASEDPIPRMPYEIRIEHPSGRIFYFPGSGGNHKHQLSTDDLNLSTTVLCDSAIDFILDGFETYGVAEKRHAVHKITGLNFVIPNDWQHPNALHESYFAYLFRTCVQERNYQLYKYVSPGAPRTDITLLPPYPGLGAECTVKINEVEHVIKRLLRCPLPRRIYLPNIVAPSTEQPWWETRTVALIEYPRGLCHECEREVWLCARCNHNPKAFCGECMIAMQEASNAERLVRDRAGDSSASDGWEFTGS